MKADLHCHTKYSDGDLTPIELATFAKEKGVDIIAITDHDTIKVLDREVNASTIPILKGVELSTYHNNECIHLLGYFKNNEVSIEIKEFLQTFEGKRKNRISKIIEKLKIHYNLIIDYDSVEKFADGVIGRVHVYKALEEKYGITRKDAFDKYIGDNQLGYVPMEELTLKDAIDILHKNNAIAVLAHPINIKKTKIEDIITLGIDGIEVYYPTHSLEDEKYYLSLVEKYNLLITGGSDFHSEKRQDVKTDIGHSTIKDTNIDILLKKLNIEVGKENDREQVG